MPESSEKVIEKNESLIETHDIEGLKDKEEPIEGGIKDDFGSMTIAEFAKTKGHIPLEDWKGDPELWTDSKTYLENQWKIDARLNAKLKNVNEKVDYLIKHQENLVNIEVKRKIKELEASKDRAIEDGNIAEVRAIDKQIKETEAEVKPQNDINPDVKKWMEKNDWYGEDKHLTILADTIAQEEQDNGETDFKKILEKVDSEMAEYRKPQKQPVKKEEVKTNPSTMVGTGNPGNGIKKTYGYNDLNADEKKFCDDFVELGLGKREDYIAQLVKANGGTL